MLVLVIDASSAAVVSAVAEVTPDSVAVLAERSPHAARGHTELLAPGIAACLDDARARPRDVGAVVAGTGPGPYTGLRVGLATAAAFADAVGAPTYGVCSLDAIGAQATGEVLVATDARRSEVYWARYDAQGSRLTGPDLARPADVPLDGVHRIAGSGGELYADVWPRLTVVGDAYPGAAQLVAAAAARVRTAAPAERLLPLYLRRPDAVVPSTRKAVSR